MYINIIYICVCLQLVLLVHVLELANASTFLMSNLPHYPTANSAKDLSYAPVQWIETKANCKEKAQVFSFVQEQFTITTANLVFFGIGKAVFNFAVGVLSDIYGRKWAIIIGWLCAIPMPFMVCVCVYVYIYIYAGRV